MGEGKGEGKREGEGDGEARCKPLITHCSSRIRLTALSSLFVSMPSDAGILAAGEGASTGERQAACQSRRV